MRYDVELLRIISAFGIVWFHAHAPGHDIAYAGLVCFVIFSGYFAARSKRDSTILNRAKRLLIPCVLWSLAYASLDLARGVEVFPWDYDLVNCILATPSLHLWYLPFVFFGVVAIDYLKRHFTKPQIGSGAGALCFLLVASAPLWRDAPYYAPLSQYLHALPALVLGVFLGCYDEIKPWAARVLLGGIAGGIVLMTAIGLKGFGLTYLVGAAPCLILLTKTPLLNLPKATAQISAATFGVYLLHPMIIIVLRAVLDLRIDNWILAVIAFVSSLIVVLVARKVLSKRLVGYVL